MTQSPEQLADAGLEVLDLSDESLFAARPIHPRSRAAQMESLRRLAVAFVDQPATILQELVDAAKHLLEFPKSTADRH